MILYELLNTENNPNYRSLEISNGNRQYHFLNSIVQIAIDVDRRFLSQQLIKAFNYHAIVCLHVNAGEYRPCPVVVNGPSGEVYRPPEQHRVPALMDDFINQVNQWWANGDAVQLATYVLWRLNNIHPFINGNGRTARAASYFILCVKAGGWLRGNTILPELIRQNHAEYCAALQIAHDTFATTGNPDLGVLHAFVVRLLNEQLTTTSIPPAPPIVPVN